MSIRRQLAIGISLLMILIMSGNLLINILQLRTHLEKQLDARADETVTTMALSMTQNAAMKDSAGLRSMVDVIFDRGHFLQVRFDYVDSKDSVFRVAPDEFSGGAPKWFKALLPIKTGYAEAFVTQGWQQLGVLQIHMHKGALYQQLWTLVKAELAWFVLMTFILLYGLRVMLIWHLNPLKDIISMAEKLANNQFLHITRDPKSKELKSLVRAMNQLSDRLQASFLAHGDTVKRLQRDTYFDSLTELHNRRGWDQFLEQWMTSDGFSSGWMMLVRIENLTDLNRQMGKNQADELLMQIAMQLKSSAILHREHVCTARMGGEFWIFSPDPLDHPYRKRIESLATSLKQLSQVQQFGADLSMAALPLTEAVAPASVKHQLDLLVSQQGENKRDDVIIGRVDDHTVTNWVHWQQKLTTSLQQGLIYLFGQPCESTAGGLLQTEIHCRLDVGDEELLLAGYFWPMVERLNLAPQFDQAILEKWLELQIKMEKQDWVVNLSHNSLASDAFRQWFMEYIPQSAIECLIIECSEYTLVHLEDKVVHWLHNFVENGGRLSVDRVGTSGKSFGFLARFPIHQGKIEKRFIHNIHQQEDHAFFVAAMIQVFHAQNALCLVEGVELDQEKDTLIDLGVDGVMGYGIAKPQVL